MEELTRLVAGIVLALWAAVTVYYHIPPKEGDAD
jgi:hypothetical protein